LTEFLLQRLDFLLDVRCLTELCWCCVNHSAGSLEKCEVGVKPMDVTAIE
jgi:hypothetical protein